MYGVGGVFKVGIDGKVLIEVVGFVYFIVVVVEVLIFDILFVVGRMVVGKEVNIQIVVIVNVVIFLFE